jgi:hypothetical protein
MKKFLVPLAAAAAGVASLGMLATPAQASVTYGGCTATPHDVRFHDYTASGHKRVLLRVDVTCHVDRRVYLTQQGWEDDDRPGDRKDDHWYSKSQWVRVDAGTTQRVDTVVRMPDTPGDGAEELYQRARFQVKTIESYPVTSGWTRWDATPFRTIAN